MWDEESGLELPKFTALGISNVQGSPVFAVVTIDKNKLISTNHINPSSSHIGEVKQLLLKMLEQVLK
jgi:hypothetical protein